MREIRGMRLKVRELREILKDEEPFVLTFGAANQTRLIGLRADLYQAMIEDIYWNGGRRLDVDHRGLQEAVVIDILTNQCDVELNPWTYGFLTVSGTPGAYLVPASPFWMERVARGEGGE